MKKLFAVAVIAITALVIPVANVSASPRDIKVKVNCSGVGVKTYSDQSVEIKVATNNAHNHVTFTGKGYYLLTLPTHGTYVFEEVLVGGDIVSRQKVTCN